MSSREALSTGRVMVISGASSSKSGAVQIKTGDATNGVAGGIEIQTGNSNANHGANIDIFSGDAAGENFEGGSLSLLSGASVAASGAVNIGTADNQLGVTGDLTIKSGVSGHTSGNAKIQTGDATIPGTVVLTAGDSTSETGGSIEISSGKSDNIQAGDIHINSEHGGALVLTTLPTVNEKAVPSGDILVKTGDATSGRQAGKITLSVGHADMPDASGVDISAGSVTTPLGTPGEITLSTGTNTLDELGSASRIIMKESGIHIQGSSTGQKKGGGAISIISGISLLAEEGNQSGDITVSTGNQAGSSGRINIITGTHASGDSGSISINPGISHLAKGADVILRGGDTASADLQPGQLQLQAGTGRTSESGRLLRSTISLDDSSITLLGGHDDVNQGGTITIRSGSSSSSNSGPISIETHAMDPETQTESGQLYFSTGKSNVDSGSVLILSGNSDAGQAGSIDIAPGYSGEGNDGTSMILSGGSTKSSSNKAGIVQLRGGSNTQGDAENTDNIGMIEINDINIQLKAGGSETGDGGSIAIESGSSSSTNTGSVSIGSKASESEKAASGIVTLQSGDSTSSNTGEITIRSGNSDAGQAGSIDIVPGYSGEGNDGTSMILSGGSTKSSSNKAGIVQLRGGSNTQGDAENTDNIGMIEINDINIQLKAGGSETGDGGSIAIESGSSSSTNTGSVSIGSKASESEAASGIVTLQSGDSTSSNTGEITIRSGNSDAAQAGSIDIVPGYSGEGNDGTSMILSGGSTKSSSNKAGIVQLRGGSNTQGDAENTDNIGMIEINDINIQLKAGGSETGDGGSIAIESGSSSSTNTGSVSIGSKASESEAASGIVTLQSGDSTSSNTGEITIRSGNSDAGQAGSIDIVPGYSGEGNDGTVMILSGGSTKSSSNKAGVVRATWRIKYTR